MTTVVALLKVAAILIAAILIGRWYQSESRKVRAQGKPWHKIYASLPGILIIIVILLPILLWVLNNNAASP